ncbi:hypothetical protein ETU10_04330 [Apibacter muscae]|uniref:Smr/MutS family protein n=1 Tax=Apibacter muscae TaxID=2509004 RepID=UPI0011ABD580|nr:Smr/MutS family protein [Apibacter muscae]TWP24476.1 hypothetical protein ETU10_04330 [Apibacter muscae]
MKLSVGNKVSIVDEQEHYTVKKINSDKVIVVDTYGFEHVYPKHKLLVVENNKNLYYETLINDSITCKDSSESKEKYKNILKKEVQVREIDLHIGHLIDNIKDIPPHKILQRQINQAVIEIEKARKDNLNKLILIHGKGKGILKKEIYELLKTIPKIEFLEADIVKYRFGAVEIRFKK